MMIAPHPTGPGEGPHWERLALWVRDQIPVTEVDGVWVFRVLRREQKEFGTAVLSRVEGDRRRIYTATYSATIKGKQRGGFDAAVTRKYEAAARSRRCRSCSPSCRFAPTTKSRRFRWKLARWFPPDRSSSCCPRRRLTTAAPRRTRLFEQFPSLAPRASPSDHPSARPGRPRRRCRRRIPVGGRRAAPAAG